MHKGLFICYNNVHKAACIRLIYLYYLIFLSNSCGPVGKYVS